MPWITVSKTPSNGGRQENQRPRTISIAASRNGDRLLVEVTDDGRGIDPAVVRRKASEKADIAAR